MILKYDEGNAERFFNFFFPATFWVLIKYYQSIYFIIPIGMSPRVVIKKIIYYVHNEIFLTI